MLGNAELSGVLTPKCVETIYLLPKPLRHGKDIVQTTTNFRLGYGNIE